MRLRKKETTFARRRTATSASGVWAAGGVAGMGDGLNGHTCKYFPPASHPVPHPTCDTINHCDKCSSKRAFPTINNYCCCDKKIRLAVKNRNTKRFFETRRQLLLLFWKRYTYFQHLQINKIDGLRVMRTYVFPIWIILASLVALFSNGVLVIPNIFIIDKIALRFLFSIFNNTIILSGLYLKCHRNQFVNNYLNLFYY